MKALRKVDVNKPPKMTFAIGLWISLPGKSPRKANGIKAKAELNAVMRIGLSRSSEPCTMLSSNGMPSARSLLYRLMSNIPLRVAIPNNEMKPMIAGMLTSPVVSIKANTPPINAKGKLRRITPLCAAFLNSV